MLDNSSKGIPVRPLEGYFRFRQEMMQVLTIEERTSENIVRLWNMLTPEQKATRLLDTQAELLKY